MRTITPQGDLVYADADGLAVHQHGRDDLLISHTEDLEPIFEHVRAMRMLNQTGFSQGRTRRYLGSLPLTTLLARPELADPQALKKYLRGHPRLCAVNPNSI